MSKKRQFEEMWKKLLAIVICQVYNKGVIEIGYSSLKIEYNLLIASDKNTCSELVRPYQYKKWGILKWDLIKKKKQEKYF